MPESKILSFARQSSRCQSQCPATMAYAAFCPSMPALPQPYSKTRYVYRTLDDTCPNEGAPPSRPGPFSLSDPILFPGPSRPSPCSFLLNHSPASSRKISFPGSFFAYTGRKPGPGYYQYQPPPFAPAATNLVQYTCQAPPPALAAVQLSQSAPKSNSAAPVQQSFRATGQKKPPPKGCSVQGELPVYPSGRPPVLHSESMCTIHLIKVQEGQQYPWKADGSLNMKAPAWAPYEFRPFRVSTRWTIRQLLEGLELENEYPPDVLINRMGVVEGLADGEGRYVRGSSFTLRDKPCRLNLTLWRCGWTADRGEAGKNPPVVLFLLQ